MKKSLKTISFEIKATAKGKEVAKIKSTPKTLRKNYEIQIIKTKAINKGVEVFARAWTKNGEQIGFGKDGSIDIERFIIINPPLLIEAENGEIEISSTDILTKKVTTIYLKKDVKEALLQTLEHSISIKRQKFGDENIKKGKVGNTTSIIYPSLDGQMINNNSATWATVHDDTNCDSVAYQADSLSINTGYQSSKYIIIRGVFLFDTSALPDTDLISSAIISLYQYANLNNDDNDGEDYVVIASSNPASNNELVTTDFDDVGDTAFSNTRDITTDKSGYPDYRDFTLNDDGKSAIDKTGISKFSLREGHDILNHSYGYTVQGWNNYNIRAYEYDGTPHGPKLTIEHEAIAAGRSFGYIF